MKTLQGISPAPSFTFFSNFWINMLPQTQLNVKEWFLYRHPEEKAMIKLFAYQSWHPGRDRITIHHAAERVSAIF